MFGYSEQQGSRMKASGDMQWSALYEYLEEGQESEAVKLQKLDNICHMGSKCYECDSYYNGKCFVIATAHYKDETGYEWEEDVVNPWIDSSHRFPLNDEQAIDEWTENAVQDWCEKADEALKDEEKLRRLRTWAENTSYAGYKNTSEAFGLHFN